MSNPRETLTRLISAISSSDIPGFAEALGSSPGFLNEKLNGTSMTGEHAALCTIYARFREGVTSPDVAIELIQQLLGHGVTWRAIKFALFESLADPWSSMNPRLTDLTSFLESLMKLGLPESKALSDWSGLLLAHHLKDRYWDQLIVGDQEWAAGLNIHNLRFAGNYDNQLARVLMKLGASLDARPVPDKEQSSVAEYASKIEDPELGPIIFGENRTELEK